MKSVKVYLYVSARPEPNDPQYVCVSHMKIRWGRHRQNTHLPNSPAGCIEIRPDLDCFSVQDNRSARRWMNKHEQREWQRGRQMQLAVVQIKAARAAHKCEHDFFWRLSKNHGHWAQDCPEARKADWNERNGEQERRGRVTGIQQATKKGSKNLLTHTHTTRSHTLIQIPLCAMKTCLQTFFMCECV